MLRAQPGINMADSAKREKIAAARKKLKKFQNSGKNSPQSREGTLSPKPSRKDNKKAKKENKENITEPKVAEKPATSSEGKPIHQSLSEEIAVAIKTQEENTTTNPQNLTAASQEREATKEPLSNNEPTQTSSTIPTFGKRETTPYTAMSNRPTASTESLQQLSRQINGILAESPTFVENEEDVNSVAELETRNRELAAILAQQSQINEQVTSQAEQLRQHALSLQSQLEQERTEASDKVRKEIAPLKEQLQVHIQTIGILVAEKTELQSQLVQSQKLSEQRFGEIEELEGRLKASRQRVGDLERNLSTASSSSQQYQKTSQDSAKDVDRLKLDLYKLSKSHEEVKQQLSEAQEKLGVKGREYTTLQQTSEDQHRRLEMAELYVQQLSSQNDQGQQSLKVLEQLQQERDSLATQVLQYNDTVQKFSAERDQMAEQYQQYMEQLQHQNQQLTSQISSLTDEREKHITQQHELESSVLELQRKLDDVGETKPAIDEAMYADTLQEMDKVQTEYEEIRQRHEAQIRDNTQLSRFLEEKEGRILELEGRLEEVGSEAGDKAQLLENIQSDKTALSRALTQNRDLKAQLAELQNGFVKMSNDNMELTTRLQTEEHAGRDVVTQLSEQEDELKAMKETLSEREVALTSAQANSVEANKVKLLHEQIQDRLRHYEAQAQMVETLQKELHSAKDMIDALTTQNTELRSMLIKATETRHLNPDSSVESAQREDVLDSLQGTITQLETERNHMLSSLKDQRDLADHLSVKVSDLEEEVVQKNADQSDRNQVSRREYDQMKQAMEMIQEKYNKVMRDKADLSDKADQLEHIVLQLQGETDTIGEYISLYHHQRALLQQRELQKNDYISQIAKDREEMQTKLGELQALVMQLMGEKHMLSSYHQETHRPTSPNAQPHMQEGQGQLLNGHQRDRDIDWPDYTSSDTDSESEVETIVGGKGEAKDSMNDSYSSIEPITSHTQSHAPPPSQHHLPKQEEKTAHKILNLLTEIGHSTLVDSSTFLEQQFHPCKYCKGRLQIL